MPDATHHRYLEDVYRNNPCNDYYNPTLHVREGEAEVLLSVRPDFLHGGGVVHGSVYFKVLDDAATFAVASLQTEVVLTASFNIYFTRPVSEGKIRAVGRVVHQSRRLTIAEAEAFDENGRSLARGSGTFMKSNRSLSEQSQAYLPE